MGPGIQHARQLPAEPHGQAEAVRTLQQQRGHPLQPLQAPLLLQPGSCQQHRRQAQEQSRAKAMPPWYGYLTNLCVDVQSVETFQCHTGSVLTLCSWLFSQGAEEVMLSLSCDCVATPNPCTLLWASLLCSHSEQLLRV